MALRNRVWRCTQKNNVLKLLNKKQKNIYLVRAVALEKPKVFISDKMTSIKPQNP